MNNFTDTTYSITEVAEKLNLSDKTLRRWEEAGRFTPSRTEGNQRRYNMEDLQILDAIKHGSLPDQKDLLSANQAAAMLGVTEPTIERFVAEGKIHPFITVGHTFYPLPPWPWRHSSELHNALSESRWSFQKQIL